MSTERLELEVRRLGGLVEQLLEEQPLLMCRVLASEDRRAGSVVLPLAVALIGDGVDFSASELLAAALDDRTVVGEALREVLAPMVDATDGGVANVGRFLTRLARVRLAGCRLTVTPRARRPYKIRGSRPLIPAALGARALRGTRCKT